MKKSAYVIKDIIYYLNKILNVLIFIVVLGIIAFFTIFICETYQILKDLTEAAFASFF